MAQDMIHRKKNQSELESLTGYLINIADSLNIEIPYNKMIYKDFNMIYNISHDI